MIYPERGRDEYVSVTREVEVKLSAPTDLGVPQLRTLLATARGVGKVGEPRVAELDATYFDTSDFRLARHRVTLRKRDGGTDAGWHLKLPGNGFRTEIGEPLTHDATPPATLLTMTSVFAAGQELQPVARIQTRRTALDVYNEDGALIAEVADDEVRSQTLGATTDLDTWREIEIELKGDGNPKTLRNLRAALTGAGALPAQRESKLAAALGERVGELYLPRLDKALSPRSSSTIVIAAYLTEHAAAFLATDPAVRTDQPDAVHQARVAIRRLRSAMRIFAPILDRDATPDLDLRLSQLSGTLGRVRDAEVQYQRLTDAVAKLPVDLVLGPVSVRISEESQPEASQARTALIDALNAADYYQLIDDVLTYIAATTARPAGTAKDELRAAITTAHQQLARNVKVAARTRGLHHDEALHKVRKSAKRLRYGCEVLRQIYGAKTARLINDAEAVQEALGEHQDSVIMRAHLRALAIATQSADNESAFTFGLLYGLEQAKGAQAIERFDLAWEQAARRNHDWLT